MKRLHDEDLELQIRLAELQADLQIELTTGLGFFGILIAAAVGFEQMAVSTPSDQVFQQSFFIICVLVLGVLAYVDMLHFIGKMNTTRKKISKLEDRYST